MYRKFLFAAAVMAGALVFGGAAHADTMTARCMVEASAHGGKKYAVLKCDKSDRPGDFVIRNLVWEKDDRAAYNRIARLAGRRFTCDISMGSTTRSSNVETTHYNLKKCH
jgi:hypothetical protein